MSLTCYWLCWFQLTLLLMIGQEEGTEKEEALTKIHPEIVKNIFHLTR